MFRDLKGKMAIITWGGKGMGRTFTLAFAKAWTKVVVSDTSLEECRKVVDEIKKEECEALTLKCDVSKKK